MSAETKPAPDVDQPPAGSVEVEPSHWLEVRAWRAPNGARFVQLVDQSEETWEAYCRLIVKRSRAACRAGA